MVQPLAQVSPVVVYREAVFDLLFVMLFVCIHRTNLRRENKAGYQFEYRAGY